MKEDLKIKLLIMFILTAFFSFGFKLVEQPFWSGFQLALSLVYLRLYLKYKK